ncbi:MAG: hypothetical protein RL368_1692, partial [Pseudomonadota bacterium]
LEALLTESVQCFLSRKETRYPQHVNRSVSFNAIKNKALDIPTCTRSHRLVLRRSSSTTSLLLYAKQAKKSCF